MDTAMEFSRFEGELRTLFASGQYQQVFDRIAQEGGRFPEQYLYLVYWQLGMAARLGQLDQALALMDDLAAKQLWISRDLLEQSPSLESLRSQAVFQEKSGQLLKLQQQEYQSLLPLLLLRKQGTCESAANPCPLLVGLHADRQRAADSARFWAPAAHRGWFVAAPQSMQALWSGAYVWDNREYAQVELEKHLEEISTHFKVDLRRLVVAGVEMGGELAAWLPVTFGVQARGFIAIDPDGPFFRDPDQWMTLLQANEPKKLRGAILLGDDHPLHTQVQRAKEIFTAFEVPIRLYALPGKVTPTTPGYETALFQAIDYILS